MNLSLHARYILAGVALFGGLWAYHAFAAKLDLEHAQALTERAQRLQAIADKTASDAREANARAEAESKARQAAQVQTQIAENRAKKAVDQLNKTLGSLPAIPDQSADQLRTTVYAQQDVIKELEADNAQLRKQAVFDSNLIDAQKARGDKWELAYNQQVAVDQMKDKAMADLRATIRHDKWKVRLSFGGGAVAGFFLGRR